MKRLGWPDVEQRLVRFVREPMSKGRTPHQIADMATRHLRVPISVGWVYMALGFHNAVLATPNWPPKQSR